MGQNINKAIPVTERMSDKLNASIVNILLVQEVVDPFYIVNYYIKWVTTSWAYSMLYFE